MEFSRQEYWSGLPFSSPEALPDSGIEPGSLALQTNSLLSEPPGKSKYMVDCGKLIALIVLVFNSLYSCPFIVFSPTAFGPGHVTCFDQRNSYKLDVSRGLKRHSCGSGFSRSGRAEPKHEHFEKTPWVVQICTLL